MLDGADDGDACVVDDGTEAVGAELAARKAELEAELGIGEPIPPAATKRKPSTNSNKRKS